MTDYLFQLKFSSARSAQKNVRTSRNADNTTVTREEVEEVRREAIRKNIALISEQVKIGFKEGVDQLQKMASGIDTEKVKEYASSFLDEVGVLVTKAKHAIEQQPEGSTEQQRKRNARH